MGRKRLTSLVNTSTVAMIGSRAELREALREALRTLPSADWKLIERPSLAELWDADVIVWDLQPGSPAPELEGMPPDCEHAFVVHESRLGEVCRRLPITTAGSILVEPCSAEEAQAFFSRFLERHLSAGADPRRSDRDDLLQAFLLAGLKLSEFKRERGHFFERALRDLAGPLTAVGGYCGLLLDQRLGPLTDGQLDVLKQMQHSVERLSNLLASTAHLSYGALEPCQVQLKPGDITVLLDRVVALALPGAEAREIDIRLDVVQPRDVLHFDSRLVHEVLACLLNNACRFTPYKGAVDVRGYPVLLREPGGGSSPPVTGQPEAVFDGYRIDIRDFGVPIPPECLPGVFELSGECGGGFDRSGGGLELAMCRMILEAHRGTISVESGEGGTVFSVVLPLHPAPVAVG